MMIATRTMPAAVMQKTVLSFRNMLATTPQPAIDVGAAFPAIATDIEAIIKLAEDILSLRINGDGVLTPQHLCAVELALSQRNNTNGWRNPYLPMRSSEALPMMQCRLIALAGHAAHWHASASGPVGKPMYLPAAWQGIC